MNTKCHAPHCAAGRGRSVAIVLASMLVSAGALAQSLPLAGNWECNHGKVSIHTKDNWRIGMEQTGNDLTLVDANGRRVAASFVPPASISAPGWAHGGEGEIGMNVDGKFYTMAEGQRQFRLGADQRWNFVRWTDGTICFKKRE